MGFYIDRIGVAASDGIVVVVEKLIENGFVRIDDLA